VSHIKCVHKAGHCTEDDGSRYHWGRERHVTLSLDEVQICTVPGAEPVLFPSHIDVYLEQRPQERQSHINLSRNGAAGIDLTLAEARELGGALAKVLHEAANCS
jgi:hypothetical protein